MATLLDQLEQLIKQNPKATADELAQKMGLTKQRIYTLQYQLRKKSIPKAKPTVSQPTNKKKPGRPKKVAVITTVGDVREELNEVVDLRQRYNAAIEQIAMYKDEAEYWEKSWSESEDDYTTINEELVEAKAVIKYLESKLVELVGASVEVINEIKTKYKAAVDDRAEDLGI